MIKINVVVINFIMVNDHVFTLLFSL